MKQLFQLLVTAAWGYCAAEFMLLQMSQIRGYVAVGGEAFLLVAFLVFCWELAGAVYDWVKEVIG